MRIIITLTNYQLPLTRAADYTVGSMCVCVSVCVCVSSNLVNKIPPKLQDQSSPNYNTKFGPRSSPDDSFLRSKANHHGRQAGLTLFCIFMVSILEMWHPMTIDFFCLNAKNKNFCLEHFVCIPRHIPYKKKKKKKNQQIQMLIFLYILCLCTKAHTLQKSKCLTKM